MVFHSHVFQPGETLFMCLVVGSSVYVLLFDADSIAVRFSEACRPLTTSVFDKLLNVLCNYVRNNQFKPEMGRIFRIREFFVACGA